MKRRLVIILAFLIIALSLYFLFLGPPTAPRDDYYVACGCGCCGAAEPAVECLYRSNGDSIDSVILKDRAIANAPECKMAGCSLPIKYVYCD